MHARPLLPALALLALPLAALATEPDWKRAPSWKLYTPPTNNLLGLKPKTNSTAGTASPSPAASSRPGAARNTVTNAFQAWMEALPPGMVPPAAAPEGATGKGGKYTVSPKTETPAQLDPGKVREKVFYGLAARYEDEAGLEKDPDVLVMAGFDDGAIRYEPADDWCGTRWDQVSSVSRLEPVLGEGCLVNTWAGTETGGTASRWLLGRLDGRDRRPFFMRLYHRFDEGWYGDGKVFGLKGFGFVGYAKKVGADVPCDGRNWFSCEMQWTGWGPSAKPGAYRGLCIQGHFYSYSTALDQVQPTLNDDIRRNENPNGGAPYRFSAYTPPYTWLHPGEWHCFEVGILPNTPGRSDGEGCLWIDGRLETRVTGLRYFDLENAFRLYATIQQYRTQTDNTKAPQVSRYVDSLVIARRYIGPIRFSQARLQQLRERGIVVHVENPDDVAAMRRARDKKK